MSKYLVSILIFALTFGAIESITANAGVMNGDEACICIGPRSNGFNATGTRRNGTCARSQTGPFCFTEGGNGDGIMVVTDEQPYADFCSTSFDPRILAEAVCPEGKVLVAVDCETDPQIPQQSPSVPQVGRTLRSPFDGIGTGNSEEALPTSVPQSLSCRLSCSQPASPGISGTLTAVAFCEQP